MLLLYSNHHRPNSICFPFFNHPQFKSHVLCKFLILIEIRNPNPNPHGGSPNISFMISLHLCFIIVKLQLVNFRETSMNLNQLLFYESSLFHSIQQGGNQIKCTYQIQLKSNRINSKAINSELCKPSEDEINAVSHLFPAVGLVRVNWRNSLGELVSINYGTGFAVSSRMFVTCTHNLYSQRLDELPSEVIFITGMNGPCLNRQIYKCSKSSQIRCEIPSKSFSYSPLKEELALVLLDEGEEIRSNSFVKIGSFSDQNIDTDLKIIGYPSLEFFKTINLDQVTAERVTLKGGLHSIEGHVINHRLATNVGQSGSPILAKDKQGDYYAVGIHTHRGIKPQFNSGLYFNDQILTQISKYDLELNFGTSLRTQSIFHNDIKITKAKFPYPEQIFIEFDQSIDNRDSQENLQRFCEELDKCHENYSDFLKELTIHLKNMQELEAEKERETQESDSSIPSELEIDRNEYLDFDQKSQESFFQEAERTEETMALEENIDLGDKIEVEIETQDDSQNSKMYLPYFHSRELPTSSIIKLQLSKFLRDKSYSTCFIQLEKEYQRLKNQLEHSNSQFNLVNYLNQIDSPIEMISTAA